VKVLITGASGFVGGALFARLRAAGTFDVLGTGRRALPLDGYVRADLTRPVDFAFRPDVVVHSAARAAPWGTHRAFHAQNVTATENLLDFCTRNGMPRVVYVSTSAVFYRNEDQLRMTEQSPIGPRFVNAYAATKRAAERLVEAYRGSWIVMRPRAVFGPGDTTVFPRIVRAAREGKLPRFRRKGAPAQSDLVYVDTLCDYIAAAAVSSLTGAYNVTNGEPVETEAFLFGILERLGIAVPKRYVDVRVAHAAAAAIETFYRVARPGTEPPITRFGVSAMAYSKTFDVTKLLAAFGPATVPLGVGVERFVASLACAAA
jgi:2-alkyl-3-oxoalkanoate reductase